MKVIKVNALKGEVVIPGDKSISHRAIMCGALSKGTTEITNYLYSQDCLSTISCFKDLGVKVSLKGNTLLVYGKGLHGLHSPKKELYTGNSGTTIRILTGILSGQTFSSQITGDDSIQKRPMNRIITPLKSMGADIKSINENGCAPLLIKRACIHGVTYSSPIASAQVKSAVIFAGLYADSPTRLYEPVLSRNHTELMLSSFGAKINVLPNYGVEISPEPILTAQKIEIPGDISSASYFIVAASIVPNAEIRLINVGINATRDGILKICKNMGANISIENERLQAGEKIADLVVTSATLTGTTIEGCIIPTLIDEIPILAVMAAFSTGVTIIKNAEELRVKESDRIEAIAYNLKEMGASVSTMKDGLVITGGKPLHGAHIKTYNDHRIAMSFAIAGLMADGETTFDDISCVAISYPSFFKDISNLITNK